MKFIADEGLDQQIVTALREADFDVTYILETAPGADDETVLDFANSQGRILLTQDKDFGELVYRLKYIHSGIILVRLMGLEPSAKAKIVRDLLLQHKDELPGSFTVIQQYAIRIRR